MLKIGGGFQNKVEQDLLNLDFRVNRLMLTVLSLMDDRSRPKGSRDPLGIEAIWSFMGRKVVGNLTTVTSNLDNFMVALLCCHHANASSDQPDQIQTNYLRAEQLAAYLRLAAGNENFLGITRPRLILKAATRHWAKMKRRRSSAIN